MTEHVERKREVAFTLVEVLIAAAVLAAVIGVAIGILVQGQRSSRDLGTHMSLAQASRKALVRILGELQEGMEVVVPTPGSTKAHALVRDKLALMRWYVQHPQPVSKPELYELWRYTDDPSLPRGRRREKLLSNVKRLRFTSTSEGILQMNLTLIEDGHEYSILTAVRLRNLASSEAIW